jgi:hypothetical protein
MSHYVNYWVNIPGSFSTGPISIILRFALIFHTLYQIVYNDMHMALWKTYCVDNVEISSHNFFRQQLPEQVIHSFAYLIVEYY